MLYPQNGDRIVAADFVTSFHLTYAIAFTPGNAQIKVPRLPVPSARVNAELSMLMT